MGAGGGEGSSYFCETMPNFWHFHARKAAPQTQTAHPSFAVEREAFLKLLQQFRDARLGKLLRNVGNGFVWFLCLNSWLCNNYSRGIATTNEIQVRPQVGLRIILVY